ncbi:MAG: DUF3667 domain-containing protein [Gammaproteobacteria bacterium]|nr:DUF3667 domain-containing protein [Gammaproteobacteria bacterium]
MSEVICPNCGAVRPNAFCGHCGQNSRDYNASLWTVLRDAIGEMFELDGRVVRSLKTIVRRPGQLSLAFAENQRASFVNPFRLFMFTTILWFFLFGITFPTPNNRPVAIDSSDLVAQDESQRQRGPIRFNVDFTPEQNESEINVGLETFRSRLEGDRVRKLDDMLASDRSARRLGPVKAIARLFDEHPELPLWLQRLMANLVVNAVYSPQQLIGEFIDNLPLMMVVLLPWYAILLMLLFGRGGRRFVHHLVFAIHVHSFSFIVLSIGLLTPGSASPIDESGWDKAWDLFDQVVFLLLMIHTYLAFRRFYGQGHMRTLVKYFSLGFFYVLGLFPAFSFVLLILLADYL